MKTWSVPLLLAFGLLACSAEVPENNTPVTGLPWQIEQLPDGNTRIFDITPGVTTLGEALALHGEELELAIIAAPGEAGSLEAYYSHFSAGPVTGKLFLVMDAAPQQLVEMRGRAFQQGGSRRYRLHPDDLVAAFRTPVRSMSFVPSINLDEKIVRSRFGTPEEIVEADEQRQHLLYPDLGLDVVLDAGGREVLQYLAPAAFTAYRDSLQ